ncbi:Fructosamine kinase-domain-containing protein [Aspergillus similis]
MTDASIWDQEIAVPENVISFVDDHVLAICIELPAGLTVVGIYPHGASYWTRTAEIKTANAQNDAVSFFLKVSQGDNGKGTMHGEFHSMTALHNALAELVPKPIAWGTYKDDPETHFFLCHFHTMAYDIPDIADFPAMVAQLHKNGVSPNGKLAQDTTECDTWEESFSRGIEHFFKAEEEAQGPDEEMTELRRGIVETVIPRLLRPLETSGRKVIPRLVHGDLWDGNTSVDAATGLPIIFDACSSYAHHEYELAPWRPQRHKIGKPYVIEYLRHFPKSEPAADFDDRNALYCVSVHVPYPSVIMNRQNTKRALQEV